MATLSVSDSLRGSFEVMRWTLPATSFRKRCELVVPLDFSLSSNVGRPVTVRALLAIVNAQITVRDRVAARVRRTSAIQKLERAVLERTSSYNIKRAIEEARRAGAEEDTLADAHLMVAVIDEAAARKAKAATQAQRIIRGWLCRRVVECPICLDESAASPL